METKFNTDIEQSNDNIFTCPKCGCHDYWFDRCLLMNWEGKETMANRCEGCGRDIDEPYNEKEQINIQEYQLEIWPVKKDGIYAAIYALGAGLEYTKQCLIQHDLALGRKIYKDKIWAEIIEKDIKLIEDSLEKLKKYPLNQE